MTVGESSDGYLKQGCDRDCDGELSDGYLKQGCDRDCWRISGV